MCYSFNSNINITFWQQNFTEKIKRKKIFGISNENVDVLLVNMP